MRPNIISLLTDFSDRDQYVGLLKAVILKINPQAKIIDLCHKIPPQDIKRAAYMLRASYKYFPQGTVHVAVVDPGVGTKRRAICLKAAGHFFIAPDNGLLSLIVEEMKPELIIKITNKRYFLKDVSKAFHGRDIFAPVAAYLSNGLNPNLFGEKISSIKTIEFPKPVIKDKTVIGEVIYIDDFGNLVTNIDKRMLLKLDKDPKRINIGVKSNLVHGIKESYEEAKIGEPLVIMGSIGSLEISANRRNAQRLLKAKVGEKVILK